MLNHFIVIREKSRVYCKEKEKKDQFKSIVDFLELDINVEELKVLKKEQLNVDFYVDHNLYYK